LGTAMQINARMLAVFIVVIASFSIGYAQNSTRTEHPPEHPSAAYIPDLGDLMFITQQRFFNIWYAGRVGHWDMADYELRKMKHTLQRLYPTFEGVSLANMINDDETRAPLSEQGRAVSSLASWCRK
jgi:hypothetical protein